MTERRGSDPSQVDELWARLLDDVPEDEFDDMVLAADVNALTASAVSGGPPDIEQMRLRLHGPSVRFHHVATRTATAALAAFQDAVSSIGATLLDRATTTGRIPSDIVRATELHLAPAIAPGSVIFTMVPGEAGESSLASRGDDALLNQSVERLMGLLRDFRDDVPPETGPMEQVRQLGPRVQKHLRELSRVLISDDLDLDLDWRDGSGRRNRVSLTSREAAKLKSVVGETSTTVEEEDLTGWLITVSSEDDQALRLQDGSRVTLEVATDLRRELRQFWDQPVRVRVQTERVTNLTTGRTLETRTIQSIAPAQI